jgi:hypothetical protein
VLTLPRPNTNTLRNCALFTGLLPSMLLAAPVRAGIVEPGGVASDFETTLADRPELGGDVIASDSINLSFADSAFTGVLNEQVVRNTSGTLNFYYQFTNPGDQIVGLDTFTVGSFTGISTDVATLLDRGGETAPTTAIRTMNGSDVIFDFDAAVSRIPAGKNSFTFLVGTDATQFDQSGRFTLDAFTTDSLDEGSTPTAMGQASGVAFKPASVNSIPLPTAAAVGIPGLITVTLYTARQRHKRTGSRRTRAR